MAESILISKSKSPSFWIRTDFLNLREMVSFGVLKLFYSALFLCLGVLLVSLVILVMPSDLGYSGEIKGFINSVTSWIEIKDVGANPRNGAK